MTKRELIEALEALDCDEDTKVYCLEMDLEYNPIAIVRLDDESDILLEG